MLEWKTGSDVLGWTVDDYGCYLENTGSSPVALVVWGKEIKCKLQPGEKKLVPMFGALGNHLKLLPFGAVARLFLHPASTDDVNVTPRDFAAFLEQHMSWKDVRSFFSAGFQGGADRRVAYAFPMHGWMNPASKNPNIVMVEDCSLDKKLKALILEEREKVLALVRVENAKKLNDAVSMVQDLLVTTSKRNPRMVSKVAEMLDPYLEMVRVHPQTYMFHSATFPVAPAFAAFLLGRADAVTDALLRVQGKGYEVLIEEQPDQNRLMLKRKLLPDEFEFWNALMNQRLVPPSYVTPPEVVHISVVLSKGITMAFLVANIVATPSAPKKGRKRKADTPADHVPELPFHFPSTAAEFAGALRQKAACFWIDLVMCFARHGRVLTSEICRIDQFGLVPVEIGTGMPIVYKVCLFESQKNVAERKTGLPAMTMANESLGVVFRNWPGFNYIEAQGIWGNYQNFISLFCNQMAVMIYGPDWNPASLFPFAAEDHSDSY